MNIKNNDSPLVNVAREEFQVSKDFPLIISLDTPVGKGTVVAGYNGNEILIHDSEVKDFLMTEVVTKLKKDKRYVTVPWVENVVEGYYLNYNARPIPVKNMTMHRITFKGVNRTLGEEDLINLPVTTWANSNYVVIGEHHGKQTDWSKYSVVPAPTQNGTLILIIEPSVGLAFTSHRDAIAPFRGFELKDAVKATEPPLVHHRLGITKQMKLARSVVLLGRWFTGKLKREAVIYQTPNHIFVHIDGVEYKAEKVPSKIADIPSSCDIYTIHTPTLTACIGVTKGYRKSKAIVTAKVRYVDTGLNWYDSLLCKIGNYLHRNRDYGIGDFMNLDFKIVDKPVSLAELTKETSEILANRRASIFTLIV